MRLGTTIKVNKSAAGIYMYPHNRTGTGFNSTCSVYIKEKKSIFHVPISSLDVHNDICWNCGTRVNSHDNITCPKCHWVKCPNCGSCRRPFCKDDTIIILDTLNPDAWNVTTGYNITDFLDKNINRRYLLLGQGSFFAVEDIYKSLIGQFLHPIIVVDDKLLLSLYIKSDLYYLAYNYIINNDYRSPWNYSFYEPGF